MSVQRFIAPTTRQAMHQVRTRLGEDALVLVNRSVDQGIEIVAMPANEVDHLVAAGMAGGDGRAAATSSVARGVSGRGNNDDVRDRLWRHLRVAGFSPRLAETLLLHCPRRPASDWLEQQLQARLRVAPPDTLLQPGVVILLGATGIGKTLTALKLAARYVQTRDHCEVVLVNTDMYRAGAATQLRAQARRLGVDVHDLQAGHGVGQLRHALRGKRLVIVDTPGFGHHDERLVVQVERLCASSRATSVLLLDARQQTEILDDMIRWYRSVAQSVGATLEDVIITKQDEATRLGPVLDAVIRRQLRLHYLTHGQQLAEDLQVAAAPALIDGTLRAPAVDNYAEAAPRLHQILHQARALGGALRLLRARAPGFAWLERVWALRTGGFDAQRQVEAMPKAPGNITALLWQGGGDRTYTVHGLDAQGLPTSYAWAQPPQQRFATSVADLTQELGIRTHIFSRVPGARARHWLAQHGQLWISRATARQHAWHDGQRRPLAAWQAIAEPAGNLTLRYRERSVHVSLYRLEVNMQSATGGPVEAWFGTLRERHSGRKLAQRYWLLSTALRPGDATQLLTRQLQLEPFARLLESAATLLRAEARARPGPVSDQLAAVLAALASRLDGLDDEWALDLRTQLINLSGTRRTGVAVLLQALLDLLLTRDALVELQLATEAPQSV